MKKQSLPLFLKKLSVTAATDNLIVLVDPKASNSKKLRVSPANTCVWMDLNMSSVKDYEHLGFDNCNEKLFPLMKLTVIRNSATEKVIRSLVVRTLAATDDEHMVAMDEGKLSGAEWVNLFPGSKNVKDLKPPFLESAVRFIDALVTAGAAHKISATFRPPQRAYLMHYSYQIAQRGMDPRNIPAMTGVDILWWHGERSRSVQAATAMVAAYGTVSPGAALSSNHTRGWAIDMSISWSTSPLRIYDASHNLIEISGGPKDGQNPQLYDVGKTYGVLKLVTDRPHWSVDGH